MDKALQFFDALFWGITCGVFGVFFGWCAAYLIPVLIAGPLYFLVPQLHNPIFLFIAFGIQAVWLGYRASNAASKSKKSVELSPPGHVAAIFAVIGAILGLTLGILHPEPPAWASGWFVFLFGGGATFLILLSSAIFLRKRFFPAKK